MKILIILAKALKSFSLIKNGGFCLHASDCHCLLPGMSQYGESQEVSVFSEFSEVGTAVEGRDSVSRSTSAAQNAELSFDRAQESTN